MTTDKQRLAEARALLEQAEEFVLWAPVWVRNKNSGQDANSWVCQARAWLAHDDEERDDGT